LWKTDGKGGEKMTYVIWSCKDCNDARVSSDNETHQMDICCCGKSGLDLEKEYTRMSGDCSIIKELKWDFLTELYMCFEEQGFEETINTYHELKKIERRIREALELDIIEWLIAQKGGKDKNGK